MARAVQSSELGRELVVPAALGARPGCAAAARAARDGIRRIFVQIR